MYFLKRIPFTIIVSLFTMSSVAHAQNIALFNAPEKLLFPSKGNELLAASGDTLMLISSQSNRKELWLYRASTGSIEKHKAEIFYKPHLFSFASHSLAFYDVLMNRFVFSKLQDGVLIDFMGDKLKGMGEESIGLSLPHFHSFNNHWLVLSLAGYAYMDNKLFYGYLTDEGVWAVPPASLFEYPEGLSQSFGLVKAYAATVFNGKQVVCTEVSGTHPIAKENNETNGLFILTELNENFTVNKHIPITARGDSALLSKNIPSSIELLALGDRLALIIKNKDIFCVKILNSDYKQVKQLPIAEGLATYKHTSIPVAKGFVSIFSSGEGLFAAYITKDGTAHKHWKIHTANISYVDFYCMADKENLYVIINDKQENQVIQKTIMIADLEK